MQEMPESSSRYQYHPPYAHSPPYPHMGPGYGFPPNYNSPVPYHPPPQVANPPPPPVVSKNLPPFLFLNSPVTYPPIMYQAWGGGGLDLGLRCITIDVPLCYTEIVIVSTSAAPPACRHTAC